jgi:hypothetical protein
VNLETENLEFEKAMMVMLAAYLQAHGVYGGQEEDVN